MPPGRRTAPVLVDWLLYIQEVPVTAGARGHIYRHDGRLEVSVVPEGLIRVTP